MKGKVEFLEIQFVIPVASALALQQYTHIFRYLVCCITLIRKAVKLCDNVATVVLLTKLEYKQDEMSLSEK